MKEQDALSVMYPNLRAAQRASKSERAEHHFVIYPDGRVSRVLGIPGRERGAVSPGTHENVGGRVWRYHPSRWERIARDA